MSTIARHTRFSPPPLSDRARRLCEDESGLEHDEPLATEGEHLRSAAPHTAPAPRRAGGPSPDWRTGSRARLRL